MSVESWLKEHYPTDARKATRSDLMAAKHSLRKWQGYTKEALAKHKLVKPPTAHPSGWGNGGRIDGSAGCALCQRHLANNCVSCPISKQTNNCTIYRKGFPYADYFTDGNPLPMIKVLKKCVDKLSKVK